jgi:Cdc6-like AAA superfamily ATPase
MPQDWDTKRYTLEDIEEIDPNFNGNLNSTNWILLLINKCKWNVIESIVTKEGQSILTKSTLESIQERLDSNIPTKMDNALNKMQSIVFTLISFLYSDLGIEDKDDSQESNLIKNIEDPVEMLQILDILAVVPPKIQEYVKILLKVEILEADNLIPISLLVKRYVELFGLTVFWILENGIKSTQKIGTEILTDYPLQSDLNRIHFLEASSPEILDKEHQLYTEPVFLRNEGIKQIDIDEGLVVRHANVDILKKKILKPLTSPINKIFFLVGAEGSGKTSFIRNLMSDYQGDAFYFGFTLAHSITPPDWTQITETISNKFSKYAYSRIPPLFILDQLHYLGDFDNLWDKFLIPMLKDSNFQGKILLANRNTSKFHSKVLEKYRGKMKSYVSSILLNNIFCLQRDTQYLIEFLTVFLKQKKNYPYKTLIRQDRDLHQLLFTLSQNLNISLLRNFLVSINWDEYPEFYEDKLQNWVQNYTVQELKLGQIEESISALEKFRITVLYLTSLGHMIGKSLSLTDIYKILNIRDENNYIFHALIVLEEQGWIK